MPAPAVLIIGWARTAIAPHGGAFATLSAHEIGAPVLQALARRCGFAESSVDAVLVGNALAAGGNPARLVSLAAGLPDQCASMSIDSQCCSGLDAVSLAATMIAAGTASLVIAGGVEAWTTSPLRARRPVHPGELPAFYDRPPFSPEPARDPDMLEAAAHHAIACRHTRSLQDAYATASHQRAVGASDRLASEIVAVAGLTTDGYPRRVRTELAARMPVVATHTDEDPHGRYSVSSLAISTKADGAAFIALASEDACRRLGLSPAFRWLGSASAGTDSAMPMRGACLATEKLLARAGLRSANLVRVIELHDAFATQGLAFTEHFGLDPDSINRLGGGLARGHPIGASGAVALVRVLSDLQRREQSGALGIATIAAAGGLGSAVLVSRL